MFWLWSSSLTAASHVEIFGRNESWQSWEKHGEISARQSEPMSSDVTVLTADSELWRPETAGIKGSLGTNSHSASAATSLVYKPANHDTEWHGTRCWANVMLLLEACLHQTPFRKVPFLVPCSSVCRMSWWCLILLNQEKDEFSAGGCLSVIRGQGFWNDRPQTN